MKIKNKILFSFILYGKAGLERNSVVTVSCDLKCSGHVDRMVGKVNRMLGMLKRTFYSRDPEKDQKFLK